MQKFKKMARWRSDSFGHALTVDFGAEGPAQRVAFVQGTGYATFVFSAYQRDKRGMYGMRVAIGKNGRKASGSTFTLEEAKTLAWELSEAEFRRRMTA